jgi:hypothetical protein
MRLQLVFGVALGVALARPAAADGTLAMRGVYYKERATRVVQPMLDAMFDAGTHGTVTGHFLVDAITSASASSGAANAEPFTETRYEAGLGYSHQIDAVTVGADAKYSTESDYRSIYAGVHGTLELAQKNTVLGLGAGLSLDRISAASAQGPAMLTLRCDAQHTDAQDCDLNVYAAYGSISQILSRNAVLGASIDLAWLDGYQSNPYRQAIVGATLVPERHPTDRNRQAFAASLRYFVEPTDTTVIAAYRYYRDSWQVHAHTPEIRLVQELTREADLALAYRYYRQDGAYFFQPRYAMDDGSMTQYVTDDVKLSSFDGHSFEAKLGVFGELFHLEGRWAQARAEAIFEYAIQHNRFGNAVIAHVALTIPFSY